MPLPRVAHDPAPADFSDVRPGDCATRWWVRSRRGTKEYLVDIAAYGYSGQCTCKDFATRFEKFLSRNVSPTQVWEERWLWEGDEERNLRPYQLGIDDLLRCWHICRARSRYATGFAEAADQAMKAQAEPRR